MSQRTPLYEQHVALGAKMVEFGGWEMPLQYRDGILREHEVNRAGCSIFDCCHMGEFLIDGDPQESGLDRLLTQTLVTMPAGSCRYGFALNLSGGTIDDLIVYRIARDRWMIVVNAANIEKDRVHFEAQLSGRARFRDVSRVTAKLDLQGPLSREVLSALVPGVRALEYYTFSEFEWLGEKMFISRTGYTGELGYEIYCPSEVAARVWTVLSGDARVKPTGLGVRDVLRIEMAYPLYGHELSEAISPLEAGLKPFVDFNKDFIGREALLEREKNDPLRMVHFISANRRAPRQGHALFSSQVADPSSVGQVASGTFSPALNVGIGTGFIKKEFTETGKKIIFGDDRTRLEATIVSRPFYRKGTFKG